LIFDGHGSHLTLEFIQICEDTNIIPLGFLPHTTHLCQPLDGKPFLSYKQHFRLINNDLFYWGGQPCGKTEFLRIIGPVRREAFNQQIIRDFFKERGIWPVDARDIVDRLASKLVIPDLIAEERRLARQYKKVYGVDPPAMPNAEEQESARISSLEAARLAQEREEVYFYDNYPF
jgi:hypothetical protein